MGHLVVNNVHTNVIFSRYFNLTNKSKTQHQVRCSHIPFLVHVNLFLIL